MAFKSYNSFYKTYQCVFASFLALSLSDYSHLVFENSISLQAMPEG